MCGASALIKALLKIITEETKVNKRVILVLNSIWFLLNSKLIQIIEFMTIKVNDFKPLDESECSENGFGNSRKLK